MQISERILHGPMADASCFEARRTLLIELEGGLSQHGIRHRRWTKYLRSISWVGASSAVEGLRRSANILAAAALLVVLSPLLLSLVGLARMAGGGIRKKQCLGRWATFFNQYELYVPPTSRLAAFACIRQLPMLYNILRGDMSFVGPRAVTPHESLITDSRTGWKRYDLRPGLLSLWWIRKRANIAYENEVGLDLEYVETNSLLGDIGIAVRALPAALFPDEINSAPDHVRFLGIRIHNLKMAAAAAKITDMARDQEPSQVCFVNADCVNLTFSDLAYRKVLAGAKLVLADGIGVRVAGAWLGQNIRENVNGTDMLPFLCAGAAHKKLGIYLLGGKPGVAIDVAKWMAEHYPALRVAGCRHGYFQEDEKPHIFQDIKGSDADVVLVALGAPRQDKWIAENLEHMGAKVAIGVGGLFDFYSGRIPRAPIWLRELGMEWLYRFWQEPRRMWRRYFVGNAVFLLRIIRERVRVSRIHHSQEVES